LVESVTVCVAGVIGGAVKVSDVALKVRVEGGSVTVNVTGTLNGFATPVTVTVTAAV
jgi:hypothetical protein